MIDREKVIKGLEHCVNSRACCGCTYLGKDECITLLMEDAIELLKADQHELVRQRAIIVRMKRVCDDVERIYQSATDAKEIDKLIRWRQEKEQENEKSIDAHPAY